MSEAFPTFRMEKAFFHAIEKRTNQEEDDYFELRESMGG